MKTCHIASQKKVNTSRYQYSILELLIHFIYHTASEDIPQGPRHNRESKLKKPNTDNAQANKVSNGADRGAKITSNPTPEAIVPAQKQGTKRKTNDQLKTEGDKSISVPPKKAKTTNKAPPESTPAHSKKPAEAPASSRVKDTSKNPKKRSSLTDNEGTTPDDPKTPALQPQPLKKPRANENDSACKGSLKKSQPLRQSGIWK